MNWSQIEKMGSGNNNSNKSQQLHYQQSHHLLSVNLSWWVGKFCMQDPTDLHEGLRESLLLFSHFRDEEAHRPGLESQGLSHQARQLQPRALSRLCPKQPDTQWELFQQAGS